MKNGLVVDSDGNKFYYKNDVLHREDGPAIEYFNGDEEWYKEGLLHRFDGPASTEGNNKYWYFDGMLHRRLGPAIEYDDGIKEWYYYGREIQVNSLEEFSKHLLFYKRNDLKVFW